MNNLKYIAGIKVDINLELKLILLANKKLNYISKIYRVN